MKKYLLFFFAILMCFVGNAQKVIETPEHGLTTASYVKITRIELKSDATVIHFNVTFRAGNWISIPQKTYIQAVGNDQKLYVQKAEGIKIGERFTIPESGKTSYVLFFPPIDESVASIDYGEGNESGSWFIYDIELIPKKWTSVLPEKLGGNWFKTNGSNSWEYGFYENLAIYQSDFWKYDKVDIQSKLFKIVLMKNHESKTLYAKAGKKGNFWFGTDPGNMVLYSREYKDNPNYKIENNEDFQLPVFRLDSAIYKGYIMGYTPRTGIKTGMVYVNDILSHNQDSYLVKINEDGTFYAKFPLYYPHEIFVRSSMYNTSVYVEPGKTTFHLIGDKNKGSLFMGECAKVNADLLATVGFNSYDYKVVSDSILNMSVDQYKNYIINARQSDIKKLDTYKSSHAVSRKAAKIRELDYLYRYYYYLLEYNRRKQSAFMTKNRAMGIQPAETFKPEVLDQTYFDLINELPFNDPVSVVNTSYDVFINRIRFSDSDSPNRITFLDILEQLEKTGIEVPLQVKEGARASLEIINAPDRNKASAEFREKYEKIMNDFRDKNNQILSDLQNTWYQDQINKRIEEKFGIKSGFAIDIIKAQQKCESLTYEYTPLSGKQLALLKDQITTPFIREFVLLKNEELIAKIEANKKKTGFRVYETPVTEADKIFDAIMEKFRGKVVYVDFWATWCGPCLAGIRGIAPLKEELADKDIVFVYITNPTSPETTYKNMIPDIKGEHFRLSQDEWNYIADKFKISGIPHYALVNKKGEVINPRLGFMSNTMLKILLLKHVAE